MSIMTSSLLLDHALELRRPPTAKMQQHSIFKLTNLDRLTRSILLSQSLSLILPIQNAVNLIAKVSAIDKLFALYAIYAIYPIFAIVLKAPQPKSSHQRQYERSSLQLGHIVTVLLTDSLQLAKSRPVLDLVDVPTSHASTTASLSRPSAA